MLATLPFEGLVIARPSLLLGDRTALGQPERPLERYRMTSTRAVAPFMPANYRPIAAADVAWALLARVPTARRRMVCCRGAPAAALNERPAHTPAPTAAQHAGKVPLYNGCRMQGRFRRGLTPDVSQVHRA